jgi:GT2 family glycosyltransferase
VNLGLAGNFNRCLAAPGTEIVTILHADDLLEPHYVATVRAAHDDVPTAACVAPMASAIDALGRPIDTLVDRRSVGCGRASTGTCCGETPGSPG